MPIKHLDEYRDPEISDNIVKTISEKSRKKIRLMEVCGTHTMSIFRSGIRALLPDSISLLSGPGCPVCVTAQREIDAFIQLSQIDDLILTTFGDLLRVPGTTSSLQKESAAGKDIRIVYSTFDAVKIAEENPDRNVVFLGVGFETTAPTIAASILSAKELGIDNYTVFSAHKLVPPALAALMETKGVNIDGFILPGHVSVIIGLNAYAHFFNTYKVPSVIAGFEPIDLLQTISMLVEQIETGTPRLVNGYPRAVTDEGNIKAQSVMKEVFETVDGTWRGIGTIPMSGLSVRKEFESFDAQKIFNIKVVDTEEPKGCACGDILTGLKVPPECPLYKTACTPADPVGPCMVSSEGTCAPYYRYHDSN